MAGTRIWRISAAAAPVRSSSVPLCVPEGQLVSSGLIALACSPAPEGFARWSLRLLEEKVVELNIVEKASDNTIGRTLKKTLSSPTAIGNG